MEGKIHFSDSEQLIIDCLRDREWHCITVELDRMIKDDRRRIVDIREKLQERGYGIDSSKCIFHKHRGNVLMRHIIKLPERNPKPKQPSFQETSKRMVALFDAGAPSELIFAQ